MLALIWWQGNQEPLMPKNPSKQFYYSSLLSSVLTDPTCLLNQTPVRRCNCFTCSVVLLFWVSHCEEVFPSHSVQLNANNECKLAKLQTHHLPTSSSFSFIFLLTTTVISFFGSLKVPQPRAVSREKWSSVYHHGNLADMSCRLDGFFPLLS